MAVESFRILMSSRIEQAIGWLVAVAVALLAGALAVRIFTSPTPPWRGLVRVQFGPLPSYFVQPVPELIELASNTFRHPRFPIELGMAANLTDGEFVFVNARPDRDTAMLELEFAGSSQHEVESLGRSATQVWAQHLATNQPPIQIEVVAVNSVDDRPAKGSIFRSRRWRSRRSDSPL